MELWQLALAENDEDFKELFGVKREIFLRMHDILTAAALERRKKGGGRPALSPIAPDPAILARIPHHETHRLRFWHR